MRGPSHRQRPCPRLVPRRRTDRDCHVATIAGPARRRSTVPGSGDPRLRWSGRARSRGVGCWKNASARRLRSAPVEDALRLRVGARGMQPGAPVAIIARHRIPHVELERARDRRRAPSPPASGSTSAATLRRRAGSRAPRLRRPGSRIEPPDRRACRRAPRDAACVVISVGVVAKVADGGSARAPGFVIVAVEEMRDGAVLVVQSTAAYLLVATKFPLAVVVVAVPVWQPCRSGPATPRRRCVSRRRDSGSVLLPVGRPAR